MTLLSVHSASIKNLILTIEFFWPEVVKNNKGEDEGRYPIWKIHSDLTWLEKSLSGTCAENRPPR